VTINNVDKFRGKMIERQVCVGTAVSSADPAVSELLAEAGYDFTWIDTEHCPIDLKTALGHIMAVRGTGTAPFVRVPANDPVLIKPVLDLAPAGVIIPLIRNAQDARDAVRACKYPPAGIRGYGPRRGVRFGATPMSGYLSEADAQTLVILQIEQIEAVEDLDSILAVPGVDALCIGPNDLSGSMGLLGQIDHPEVMRAIDTIIQKTLQTGLFLGIATGFSPETTSRWIKKGIQWLCLNTDYVNLFVQSKAVIEGVHKIVREAG
jgi:2-keto-3-deoxy-L-rhamnonate aldolase RhmA